jgi:hypothetical protein
VAALEKFKPALVITGMAIGWDQAIAEAAVRLEIPFIATALLLGQEAIWGKIEQRVYNDLLAEALRVEVISRHTGITPAYKACNRWPLDP